MNTIFRLSTVASQFATLLLATNVFAAPNALLPRPQDVHYGQGELPVKGLAVCYAMSPNPEDEFTAEQLADGLSAGERSPVHIQRRKIFRSAIVLRRTGNGASLPGMNQHHRP